MSAKATAPVLTPTPEPTPVHTPAHMTAHVIPLAACPPELAYLSHGKTVGLRVQGRLTADGVVIEAVSLQR